MLKNKLNSLVTDQKSEDCAFTKYILFKVIHFFITVKVSKLINFTLNKIVKIFILTDLTQSNFHGVDIIILIRLIDETCFVNFISLFLQKSV